MTRADAIFGILQSAMELPDTSVIIRSAGAIAEIRGPMAIRRGAEWLTLGEEGSTHVHLKAAELLACRYTDAANANAALHFTGAGEHLIFKVSFRGTNPARPERFDGARARLVAERFGHLRGAAAWPANGER
jgi:hypothetical protein